MRKGSGFLSLEITHPLSVSRLRCAPNKNPASESRGAPCIRSSCKRSNRLSSGSPPAVWVETVAIDRGDAFEAGAVVDDLDLQRQLLGRPVLAPHPEGMLVESAQADGATGLGIGGLGGVLQQVLEHLELWSPLQPKLVRGDSIAQTFQFIASGNAQAGLVALAQVKAWPNQDGTLWRIPQAYYAPIDQQAILLKRGADNAAARDWLAFLQSPEAAAIIQDYGYDTAD